MIERRSYNEYCGVARALDVVGERWTLLVVRNLLLGPLRYSDLLRGLPGITTNLLAKRLREMEEGGVVERIRAPSAETSHLYRLTDLGRALEPVIHALGAWGWSRMQEPPEPGEHRDLDWLLVGTRRRYRGGLRMCAEFVVEGSPYHFLLDEEHADIGRGPPVSRPDVRVRTSSGPLVELLLHGWPEAGEPEGMVVEGRMDQLRTLIEAFEHPRRKTPRTTVAGGA